MQSLSACIFDLDGVIVDTAKYHFLAWNRLASEWGFDFTLEQNEQLKGVSRMRSLEILLNIGGITLDEDSKQKAAARKNEWYVEYISNMDESELLPGAKSLLLEVKEQGFMTALGSASKNATLILDRTHITKYFDVIVDGNKASKAKPNPEVFLRCASELRVPPRECIVFEDAKAGIEAAIHAGMRSIGVGSPEILGKADRVVSSLAEVKVQDLLTF